MAIKTSAAELAKALDIHKSTVTRRAKKEKWPFTYDKVRGGHEKQFIVKLLPDPVRLVLAKHRASKLVTITGQAATAGAEAGEQLTQAKAGQAERQRITKEKQLAAFAQVSKEKQAIAYARMDILQARDAYLQAAGISNRKKGSAAFCEQYNQKEIRLPDTVTQHVVKVSVSTLQRWQREFNNSGMMGLANGYRNPKKGSTSLPQEQQHFIIAMLKKQPHSSIATVDMAMAARFQDPAHVSTTRRFINKWKKENASLFLFITNPDAWRNKHQFAVGDAAQQCDRLNQVWEFDSTPADVMLVDGRHNIIGVIDVYTRRLKLLISKTSRAVAVAALIRKAIMDWGVPEIAKTDNGADYVSHHIVQVFNSLEIEQKLCPPFTPENKPHIERVFKTFSHSFAELMPGYIGHSVADRKDIEARKSFAQRLGNKDSAVSIKMTAEELQQYCDRWCDALYHQKAHRGLDGRTPGQVARAWKGTEKRISEVRALDILLAEAPQGGGFRTVTKQGVSVNRIEYISDNLAGLEGERVRVKLDPADLGTIYLFDENGKFLTIAVDPMRTGIDRAEIAAKLAARQKAILKHGSKELRKIAREQAVDEIHEEILGYHEAKRANIVELPGRSEEYTTPAMGEASKAVAALEQERREEQEIEDIIADTEIVIDEVKEPEPAQKENKVVLLLTDADRYQQIKTRQRTSGLSQVEHDFLTEYYKTRSGRMYMELEGDLRDKLGLAGNKINQG